MPKIYYHITVDRDLRQFQLNRLVKLAMCDILKGFSSSVLFHFWIRLSGLYQALLYYSRGVNKAGLKMNPQLRPLNVYE